MIQEAKPSKLYLVSDGPRNDSERVIILGHRKSIEEMIDWDVELTTIYLDENIGIDGIMDLTYKKVFEKEDRMIFLEEDIYPSFSFFVFCDELLERYKDDERIFLIGGMNSLGEYPNYSNEDPSYFFANGCSTWGMAIWKRTYSKFQKDFSILDNRYNDNIIREFLKIRGQFSTYQRVKFLKDYPQVSVLKGELFLMMFNQNLFFNSLAIIPSKNLILNLGNSEGAENSDTSIFLPKSMRFFEKMKLHELKFPLRHPEFMIADYYHLALQKKLYPPKNSLMRFIQKTERGLRILLFGGPRRFWNKFKKFVIRYWGITRKEKKYK